jgi:hypothetical protein
MTTENTYNGWTNHETWCVNLWLTNEPATDETLRFLAQMNASEYWRADRLKDYVRDLAPDSGPSGIPGMFVDLLMGALNNVNWQEIITNHEHDDDPDGFDQKRLKALRGTDNEPYPRIEDCIECGRLFEPDRKDDDICINCA